MQVVEFPSDIVYATEHVELPVEVLHGVSVSLRRNVALVLHPAVLEVSQTELPEVLHPGFRVLAAEQVEVLPVSRHCAATPRQWYGWVFS